MYRVQVQSDNKHPQQANDIMPALRPAVSTFYKKPRINNLPGTYINDYWPAHLGRGFAAETLPIKLTGTPEAARRCFHKKILCAG